MESNNNFTIADALQWIGLLIFGVLIYYGAHYFSEGKVFIAAGTTLIILILLWLSVYIAVNTKKNNEYKSDRKIVEIISILGFCLIAGIGSIFAIHGQNVEFFAQDEIKINKKNQLDNLINIVQSYKKYSIEKKGVYQTYIQNQNSKGVVPKRNPITDGNNFERRINEGFSAKDSEIQVFVELGKNTINNWDIFKIHNLLLEIPNKKQNLLEYLHKASNSHWYINENKIPFEYKEDMTNTEEIDISDIFYFFKGSKLVLPIIILLLINALILVPYFAIPSRKPTPIIKDPNVL